MSDVPSWLTEENITTATKVASNPAVQKAAANPAVQKAALNAASNPSVQQAAMRSVPPPPPPAKATSTNNPAFDPEAGSTPIVVQAEPVPSNASDFIIEEETLKQMQKWHLALRVLYICSTALMGLAAGLALQKGGDIGIIFFAFYVFFFAVLICCFEFALNSVSKLIAVNFGFMYTLSGRATFLLFVGFMCFSLGTVGIVSMCVLYAVGLFHAYIMYKFPRFEEYLRKKHYFEGRQGKN